MMGALGNWRAGGPLPLCCSAAWLASPRLAAHQQAAWPALRLWPPVFTDAHLPTRQSARAGGLHQHVTRGKMTTIRQFIQSSPNRANELFAKLVDTSESAVKTREKLFTDLKEELELLAKMEEQHLFPVLKKHKDLKELVRDALQDNKATMKLLTELDHTPKDTEEFGTRVAELHKV